jgi:flavin-dependent dehydrogenase
MAETSVNPDFDAIVIGGGPAGSTVAHLLAKAGKKVVLLEKDQFPRFHIGESLLPFAVPIFERLGVLEELKAKCQRKLGAYFSEEGKTEFRKVVFAEGLTRGYDLAFQVKRAEFDELLLKAAQSAGADVRFGWRVERLLRDKGKVTGVAALDGSGSPVGLTARIVVDASGRDALGSRAESGIRPEKKLRRSAIYAHFRNVPKPDCETEGDIRMVVFETGWWWFIPFSDGTWSVGVVSSDPPQGRDLEERLEKMIQATATVRERLKSSARVSPVRSASDYSYSVKNLTGDGYVAVGDAAGFLDPIFSSGVFLALATAERAADEVVGILSQKGEVSKHDLRRYERYARKGFSRFRSFVIGFYDPAFRDVFYTHPPVNSLYSSVTTVLSGGVFSRSPLLRFWSRVFLLFASRAMRRRRRRQKRLSPAPAA